MAWTLNYVLGDKSGFEGIKSKMGGKTGTTQDQSDGWYMGISPNLCVGVWVGCDDRFLRFRTMTYGQGAKMARPIYQKLLRKIEGDPQLKFEIIDDFTKPDPFDVELNCGAYSVPDASFLGNNGEDAEWGDY
jgi:penicillin-binding protein 1A